MSGLRTSLVLLALLGLMAAPTAVTAESPPDSTAKKNRSSGPGPNDAEKSRLRLEEWKKLSPEQKERLRKLDRQFHSLDPKKQDHLRRVMERYQAWLQRLPEADRKRIESAPNREERLKIVTEIREKQWLERLPKADAEQLQGLEGPARAAKIKELHEKQRQARQKWEKELRRRSNQDKGEGVTRLSDLPMSVQQLVTKELYPKLTDAERKELQDQDGKPTYYQTLHTLFSKHQHQFTGSYQAAVKSLLEDGPPK